MKKKIGLISATLILLCAVFIPAFAANTESDKPMILTPALNVLAAKETVFCSAKTGQPVQFSAQIFDLAFGIKKIPAITIITLPPIADGYLQLGTLRVQRGQTIARQDLSSLQFVPASAQTKVSEFEVANGGCEISYQMKCALQFYIGENTAPVVANPVQCVSTLTDVAVMERLLAQDPQGDSMLYTVAEQPKHGVFTWLDQKMGTYRYIPELGYTGNDAFSYTVQDCYGYISEEAQVQITISPTESALYVDMIANSAHAAAIRLSEAGVITGMQIGGKRVFDPERKVTRCEFLTMAMKAAGYDVSGITVSLPFADAAEIPQAYLQTVMTAYAGGIIKGEEKNGKQIFAPNGEITRAEAAVILQRMVNAAVPTSVPGFADTSEIPVWAEDAVFAMYEIGVFTTEQDGSIGASTILNRAGCAKILDRLLIYATNAE